MGVKFLSAILMAMNCIIVAAVVRNRVKDLNEKMIVVLTAVAFVQVCTGIILSILILAE